MTSKPAKPLIFWLIAVCLFFAAPAPSAAGAPVKEAVFVARAESDFVAAWTKYLADTNSTAAALEVGRTSADLTGLDTNDTQRAEVARRGIAVCQSWIEKETNSGPAHYYLAINLGQLAQAEAPSIASYRLVHQVEREFKKAAELDVTFDHAGPARTLGLLYFQAPGWPLSVGSKSKAREWLTRAAELAPNYPGNQLNLGEAQLKWREHKELKATLKKLDAIWPIAQTNLVGQDWQENWQDWETRRAALKADYQRIYGDKD